MSDDPNCLYLQLIFFIVIPVMESHYPFEIYKASAGSGKTYTLVREYLRLALAGPQGDGEADFRNILAITFTNKAANEMKDRVLSQLSTLASVGDGCDMGSALCEGLGWEREHLRQASARLRADILHHYSDFSVLTIDRFVVRLVRTFARELGLPLNFNVLTEHNELIDVSVDELLDMAGQEGNEELSEVLFHFAVSNMEHDDGYHIEREIRHLAERVLDEESIVHLQRLATRSLSDFISLHRSYDAANRHFVQSVTEAANKFFVLLNAHHIHADDLLYGAGGVYGWFLKNAQGDVSWPPSKRTVSFFEGEKHSGSKCSKSVADLVESLFGQMQGCYDALCGTIEREINYYNTRTVLLKKVFPLALLNRVLQLVEKQYGDLESVHISAFNKKIHEVVQEEPMPFIYERLGSRYSCVLIDEFQDTSRLQWQNLLPLVENCVASNGYALVVGDAKQAIYRFRQGDVAQFVALPHVDNSMHGALLSNPGMSKVITLEYNYRSLERIVTFNNALYSWLVTHLLSGNALLKRIFIGDNPERPDLCQQYMSANAGKGAVSMSFWTGDQQKSEVQASMWQRTYDIICDLVDNCGYDYSDIAILARKKKTLNAVSFFLSESDSDRRQTPMVSSESFLLSGSLAVQLLRSALLWVHDGFNALAATEVLTYMYRLHLLKHEYSERVAEQGLATVEDILSEEGYKIVREPLRSMSIYECCESLIREFRLQDVESDYVTSFLGCIHHYTSRNRDQIDAFVEWFDQQEHALATSDTLNAVRLSTIHKYKGLESPVVICLFPQERTRSNEIWVSLDDESLQLPSCPVPLPSGLGKPERPRTIYESKLQEEQSNIEIDLMDLLYVATTRPREKLFLLCHPMTKEGDSVNQPLPRWLMQFADAEPAGEKEQHTIPWKRLEAEGYIQYDYGDLAQPRAPHPKRQENPRVHPSLHFAPWETKVEVAKAPSAGGIVHVDARDFGLAMHELLSSVDDSSDVDAVVAHFCSVHAFPPRWQQLFHDGVVNLLSDPRTACFFDHRVTTYNECEMMYHGHILRPDRILFFPDQVWIVDFKTGDPEEAHTAQVRGYMQAIRSMGYATVKGFLLYTQTLQVDEVK